jgi:hypothetical protein
MTDALSTPSERLKSICETYYGGNKSKMGKAMDISYQNINNYIEKGKKPSFEVIQKVYEIFKDRLNPTWLILGEGDMFIDGVTHPHASSANASATASSSVEPTGMTKQLFDYQSMIIELQQKIIRQLEK